MTPWGPGPNNGLSIIKTMDFNNFSFFDNDKPSFNQSLDPSPNHSYLREIPPESYTNYSHIFKWHVPLAYRDLVTALTQLTQQTRVRNLIFHFLAL